MATTATFYHKGETLDYPNTTEAVIPANTIVSLGTRVGVIGMDIQPGENGVVPVEGVIKMPTVTGAISMGTAVYLNSDGKVTTTETSNVPAGYVTADAASADAVACVKLLG